MSRSLGIVAAFSFMAAPLLGAGPGPLPEALLAEDSLAYFRYDGLEAHRAAFERSAWAECVRGDAGTFLEQIAQLALNPLGVSMVKDRLLQGVTPDRLYLHQAAAAKLPRLMEYLRLHGLVVGVEASMLPLRWQVTLVVPMAARDSRDRDAVAAGVHLLASFMDVPVRESKQGERTLLELTPSAAPFRLACWSEGDHVVCTVGTDPPEHTLRRIRPDGANLTRNRRYQEVVDFKPYETLARSFFDPVLLAALARPLHPKAGQLLDDLGLNALQAFTMHWGFEGRAQRSSLVLHLRGERKGLLRVAAAARGIQPGELPALPPDVSSVLALHFDAALIHDVVLQATETVIGALQPDRLATFKQNASELAKTIGFDLRKDLLEALGSTAVFYNSPGEGPILFGPALAIQVKDVERVRRLLQKLELSLPALLGGNVSLRKLDYHGTTITTLHRMQFELPFLPTWALHRGWLVAGLSPQTVQGFVMRAEGKHAVWKPAAATAQAWEAAARQPRACVLAVSEMDPRLGLQRLCQLGPLFFSLLGTNTSVHIDPALVPNFQAVTEPLFPNVTLLIAEDNKLRLESRASVFLFVDLAGPEIFALISLVSAL